MGRTDFTTHPCPVARSMAVLGERWAILILREAFYGTTRFDAFERHLGIAPNILSARLRDLVAHGLLERGPGPRPDYRLTEKGADFFPAYLALKRWSDRWMAPPEGPVIRLEDRATGEEVVAPLPRSADGRPITHLDVRLRPGPGAPPALRARLRRAEEGRADDAA